MREGKTEYDLRDELSDGTTLADDRPLGPAVVSPIFSKKGKSSAGYIESKVQKGIWKGVKIRVQVEIVKLAHCQSCSRLTPYRFSLVYGYISWRQCAKCLTEDERKAVKQLFGKSEREIISNMQDYTVNRPNGR